ncbi:MAG: HU family DNA-binding protein [Gammaproteobacteria bacterium]
MMNKTELVNILAQANDLTKAAALQMIDTIFRTMRESLAKGEEVVIPDFGKFVVETRAARAGRNPKTGVTIDIPAAQVVKFKVAKALKDIVQELEEIA